ncbi:cytochrome c oxidase subunit I [Polyangium spumosum]|uniref:Cytochrome c oxidase subunit 1 n=1 Tax=Polyangium spumosum TaxID=889282 RepID=A0A6N7PWM9_9BACT|nr:cytochrome c oxidase subunit I [Polyangium spumosum]MRG96632.1 cytochrome c oxidase subunit I [Polyangium spumosum]
MSDGAATRLDRELLRIWANPPGVLGFLTNVNHKAIGARFLVTSFVFFLIGGVEALVMRLQLARPEADVVGPGAYAQLFTMHGSTMMFLFAVPFLEGLAIYLVPLMIGARDMAFPRLNAFGYWVYLFAGIALHVSLLLGLAPDTGWYAYVPLSGPGWSSGPNVDMWVTMITFLEVSALVAAVELIVTIFKMRAPGMSLSRMPVFVWAILLTAFMIVFAMPTLVLASLLLALDRFAGAHFFNVAARGDPLLWQHLFWFFGHPDVYIMLLPALGIVSTIVPTAARRPLAGYTPAVLSLAAISVASFGLWVHHMYPAGLPLLGMSFFTVASMLISIPNAVLLFTWIATLWGTRPAWNTPFLFVFGFFVLLILGGITGIMIASVPFDWQVTDTHFIVAHFHYVLIGGVVFPIFAAIYHWFPKITGVTLGERAGRVSFWLVFIGFNVTFFPLHILGLQGMPRRAYTYLAGLGWDRGNGIATAGALLFALGVMVSVADIVFCLATKRGRAPADPWGGATLEWSVSSPPPVYNFCKLPVVRGTYPLWSVEPPGGVRIDDPSDMQRETLSTSVLAAVPEHRVVLPGPTIWPFWLAASLTVAFLGAMVDLLFVPVGALLGAISLMGWLWPSRASTRRPARVEARLA